MHTTYINILIANHIIVNWTLSLRSPFTTYTAHVTWVITACVYVSFYLRVQSHYTHWAAGCVHDFPPALSDTSANLSVTWSRCVPSFPLNFSVKTQMNESALADIYGVSWAEGKWRNLWMLLSRYGLHLQRSDSPSSHKIWLHSMITILLLRTIQTIINLCYDNMIYCAKAHRTLCSKTSLYH